MNGADAIAWIESFCRIPKGPNVGEPIRLLDFQKAILRGIFDTATRRAFVSMARQNGKTLLAACLMLLHLCGPRHQRNGLLVSSALTREQASILFTAASQMIRLSPELSATVDIIEFQKTLRCPALGTSYRALSADALPQLGLSPYFIAHDELGGVLGPYSQLFDVLESGAGAQANPLSIVLSTQARSDSDLLSRLMDDAQTGADPQTKLFLYTADPALALLDETSWRQANPAAGEFLRIDEIRAQAESAQRMPSMEASFRNLHRNERIDAVSQFISQTVWRENGEMPSALEGSVCYGGLDLSSVSDLTALVLVAEDGSTHCFAWLPAENIEEKSRQDKVAYSEWAEQGLLLLCPGRAINYDFVARFMREVFDACDVRAIAFDRVFMKFLRPCLTRAGFTEAELERFVEYGQGYLSMSPAIRELEVRLLEKKLRHGNHPLLAMAAAGAAVVTDDAGGRKFTKKKSSSKIDPLVALAMACAVLPDQKPEPAYNMFFV